MVRGSRKLITKVESRCVLWRATKAPPRASRWPPWLVPPFTSSASWRAYQKTREGRARERPAAHYTRKAVAGRRGKREEEEKAEKKREKKKRGPGAFVPPALYLGSACTERVAALFRPCTKGENNGHVKGNISFCPGGPHGGTPRISGWESGRGMSNSVILGSLFRLAYRWVQLCRVKVKFLPGIKVKRRQTDGISMIPSTVDWLIEK